MSYCINPSCPKPNDPANVNCLICRNCGSDLLLQGRYQVMRVLSDNSGFGKVYEAYQGAIPKILKVLKTKHNHNARVVELFQQEAVVLSKLNHPGSPKVSADGYFQFIGKNCQEPVHCLIMEKIDGLDLRQWMKQQNNQPISEKQALNWLKQLAEILHLVHQQNYFHRDIKPANIMIRSTGQLVLIDFGTARELTYTYLAEIGDGLGNVTKISCAGYTPPEQEKGHAVPQSDFYALGRTFVYLLTGKPATDSTIYDPLTDLCNWRQYAPHISATFADFIDKLMAPTAAARHKDTQEILDSLAILLQKINQPKVAATSNHKTFDKAFNNRFSYKQLLDKNTWLLVPIVALITGFGGYITWSYQQPHSQVITTQKLSVAQTINGHSSFINYLIISPDGQTLASASADKTIKLWNLATGKEIKTLRGHTSFVNYLAISRDGQTLVSASADKTIQLWNLTTGKEIKTLIGHANYIDYFVISSDWQTIATGSADHKITVWNLITGKEMYTLTGHSNRVNFVAISPDGHTLVSASADQTIKLWNLATGKEIRTLTGHSSFVNYLSISPDGQTLASASTDKTIKIWNLLTGQEIKTLTGHSSFVNYLSISADGQTLASASTDKTIKIWNLVTGQEIYTLTGHSKAIDRLAISSDGQTIATGSGGSKISIWRLPK